jgi:hypothetical protein
MCSSDGADLEQTQTFRFHFLLDVGGTFVERLLIYCFDITTPITWKAFKRTGRIRQKYSSVQG